MKNKISKRRLKIKNRKRHEDILSVVSNKYTIDNKTFGSGYFIFSFEVNSVCWFWLKEMPDWKFGIWLSEEDNSYDIFGEAILQIDKFKPCRSTLSEKNVEKFVLELNNIQNNIGEWKEYNEYTEEAKRIHKLEIEFNKKSLEAINEIISEEEEKFSNLEVPSLLVLVDQNTKNFSCSPRYIIHEKARTSEYFETEESAERTAYLFKRMSLAMPYLGNWPNGEIDFEQDYLSVDDFLFEHRYIINPKDFLEEEIRYERKEPITDFDDLVEKFKKEVKGK